LTNIGKEYAKALQSRTSTEWSRRRAKVRSDVTASAHIDAADEWWENRTRPSELTGNTKHAPGTNKETHVRHYLDVRIEDFHKAFVLATHARHSELGCKCTQGTPFQMSMKVFTSCRPYHVVNAKPATSLCRYHLQMTYMAEALYSLRKRLVESGICACTHPNLKSSIELKRSIICYNPDLRYDDVACINGTCNICKDHTLLHVCGCCLRERIVYEQYGDIEYATKDGTI